MPTITSAASGLASDPSTWAGGVVPVEGDKVIIAQGHTVTIDGTFTWGDNSVTETIGSAAINVSGTLKASRLVNSSLTALGLIYTNYATKALDFGTVADPIPKTITASLILNKATVPASRMGLINRKHASGAGNFTDWSFVGDGTRARHVTLQNATTASADIILTSAAHGWVVGDSLMLLYASGGSSTVNETESRTITGIAGSTITLNAAPTYLHKEGARVCNMTCNVRITSFNLVSNQCAQIVFNGEYAGTVPTLPNNVVFRDVSFGPFGSGGQNSGFTRESRFTTAQADNFSIDRCVLDNSVTSAALILGSLTPGLLTVTNSNLRSSCAYYGAGPAVFDNCNIAVTSALGVATNYPVLVNNSWVAGTASGSSVTNGGSAAMQAVNTVYSGIGNSICPNDRRELFLTGCDVGFTYGWGDSAGDRAIRLTGLFDTIGSGVLMDCLIHPRFSPITVTPNDLSRQSPYFRFQYLNKNNDLALQEIYTQGGITLSDSANTYRSNRSISLNPVSTAVPLSRSLSFPCAAGASVRVIGYVQKSHASNVAATVALTGLGSAWGGFTAANDTTWQVWDTGNITNSSGADGNFTLTYTATSSSGLTNVVYFDGVPDSPFVTKCRHYGFVFDESNLVRVVNPAITEPVEATAYAYTGVTINTVTPQITVGAGTANTFQKVYDYTQAWACQTANITSPALLSSVDGNNFALPTTCRLSWPGMGADGTLVGGRLLLAATGTHTYKLSGTVIEFQTVGIYGMGATAFSGTVELVNTSGGAVTVQLPAGTSYTNTGPNITVSTPTVNQSVAVNGVTAGSRVQIYDTTNSVELFNGTSGYSWTDPVPAAAPRNIRVRIAYQSGTSAKNFIEANIGTCGVTAPSNAVAYLASQTDDAVYNANGLDGSAVTGITISDGIDRMVINIAGGSVSWPQIYAYNVHWLTTSAGIVDDGSIITATDNANYRVTLFKIRNSSTTPLSITGGYGVDSGTGTVAPLIDTAGSTGNIYQTPDHVVPYQTTGSYAITGDISTVLAAVSSVPANVLSAAASDPIASDAKRMNGATIQGDGTSGNLWRG